MEYRIIQPKAGPPRAENIENRSVPNELSLKKLKPNKLTPEHPAGFSALLTVLIIGVVSLTLAYSASILGLGELELGYTAQKGGEAFAAADGCMEEAMRRLRLDAGYGGSPGLSVINGSCTISIENPGGGQRRLTVLGRVGDYYKKIEAVITLNGNVITLNSWQEKSD